MRGLENKTDYEGGVVVEEAGKVDNMESVEEMWMSRNHHHSMEKPGFSLVCARDIDEDDEEEVDSDFFYDDDDDDDLDDDLDDDFDDDDDLLEDDDDL